MKVKELITLLEKCDPDADITSNNCKWFEKKFYYPIVLEYYNHDDKTLHQTECPPEEANLILVH